MTKRGHLILVACSKQGWEKDRLLLRLMLLVCKDTQKAKKILHICLIQRSSTFHILCHSLENVQHTKNVFMLVYEQLCGFHMRLRSAWTGAVHVPSCMLLERFII